MIVRADSAYYNRDVIAAARRAGARFSVTARMDPAVRKAIAGIDDAAWTPIRYPNAVWDEAEQRWISDAEVAEVPFTAFGWQRARDGIDGRLIVRRVKRLNPASVRARQHELFAAHRHQLSWPGARCRMSPSGPFPQAARRTRRADLSATGSPRRLPSGTGGQCRPGVGDRGSEVAIAGYRHRRDVEHRDPVRGDRLPTPVRDGEPATDVPLLPAVQLYLPPDHSPLVRAASLRKTCLQTAWLK